ncbi:MAG: hypothetical protein AAGC55_25350, partial [Myxococcota bacterium]
SEGAEPTERGPYFRTLKLLPFAPSPETVERYGHLFIGNLPACLVQFDGGEVIQAHPDWLEWELDIHVHVVSGHAGFDQVGRLFTDYSPGRTSLHEPGLTTIMHHVVEQLHFQDPGPRAQSIRITGMDRGADTEAWSWWRIRTTVQAVQNVCRERGAASLDEVEARQAAPKASVTVKKSMF